MSKKLTIKNVGPVEKISFDIKKINIFMGKQSSGKSTIAKILSFCNWIEKDVSLYQDYSKYTKEDGFFITKLEGFHKMQGYFNQNSFIKYKGDAIEIIYSNGKTSFKWLENRFNDYKRTKISYIPSERSVVILPEMEKVELSNNYLKSYLYDWLSTRNNFTSEEKLSILDTGIKYYYSEDTKESHIENDNYDILLSQASSGIQSITPLLTMVHNLIVNFYQQEQQTSYEVDLAIEKVKSDLLDNFITIPYSEKFPGKNKKELYEKITELLLKKDSEIEPLFENYANIRFNLFNTQRTNLIIEEPEQNLFPATQKKLCYKLIEYLNFGNYDHSLTLTTHSPYILYAINNCILTHLTKNKIPKKLTHKVPSLNSGIDPSDINIFEINNGELKDIKQNKGLIGGNYFDENMKEVMDDFYFLLSFLD